MYTIHRNDEFIQNITKKTREETLFLTFGDHGFKEYSGSHGGDSEDELRAGLFSYSKNNFTFAKYRDPDHAEITDIDSYLIKLIRKNLTLPLDNFTRKLINQIDIVPTMASIFKTPIPHNNLGIIIPEFLKYNNSLIIDDLSELMGDYLLNYLQIVNFIQVFHEETGTIEALVSAQEALAGPFYIKLLDILYRKDEVTKIETEFRERMNESVREIGFEIEMDKEKQEVYLEFMKNCTDLINNMIFNMENIAHSLRNEWNSFNFFLMGLSQITTISVVISLFIILITLYIYEKVDLQLTLPKIMTPASLIFALFLLPLIVFYDIFDVPVTIIVVSMVTIATVPFAKVIKQNFTQLRQVIKQNMDAKAILPAVIIMSLKLLSEVSNYIMESIKNYLFLNFRKL